MSSIDTTSPSGSSGSSSSSSTVVNPSSSLNDQDFLQLLVAQLQYQDPMDPTSSDSFVQEQAAFSTVEGINNMESTLSLGNAEGLIGMQVEYTGANGATASGIVSSASDSSGTVSLDVDGQSVSPSSIVQVSLPSSSSSTSSSPSATSTGGAADAAPDTSSGD